ncbi:hypothetical protein GQ53DRAFT_325154 [Thozetella sp. PMI_491]|nr:hypothetical protein GQ53DRAFT_325154 [Thozetella sp. PMI_491]
MRQKKSTRLPITLRVPSEQHCCWVCIRASSSQFEVPSWLAKRSASFSSPSLPPLVVSSTKPTSDHSPQTPLLGLHTMSGSGQHLSANCATVRAAAWVSLTPKTRKQRSARPPGETIFARGDLIGQVFHSTHVWTLRQVVKDGKVACGAVQAANWGKIDIASNRARRAKGTGNPSVRCSHASYKVLPAPRASARGQTSRTPLEDTSLPFAVINQLAVACIERGGFEMLPPCFSLILPR